MFSNKSIIKFFSIFLILGLSLQSVALADDPFVEFDEEETQKLKSEKATDWTWPSVFVGTVVAALLVKKFVFGGVAVDPVHVADPIVPVDPVVPVDGGGPVVPQTPPRRKYVQKADSPADKLAREEARRFTGNDNL